MKRATLLIIVIMAFLVGCSTTGGVTHSVRKGETLWRICKTYDASIREVSRLNNIKDPTRIRVGQKLFIPGAPMQRGVALDAPVTKASYERRSNGPKVQLKGPVKGRFSWPVKGKVVKYYGKRGDGSNGIDIKAAKGTPVKASDAGIVAHTSDDMRVYGRLIILEHSDGYFTLYAHNDENLVDIGDTVPKGAVIAKVGNSGAAREYKLHFEVRDGRIVRNPLFYLP